MTDAEIIKALECCTQNVDCSSCPFINSIEMKYRGGYACAEEMRRNALDLINRQKAELDILIRKKDALRDEIAEQQADIERLQKLQKPTETSGFKIENGKVVFYTNILNGYHHEYKDLEEVVKELNLLLRNCYKVDDVVMHYKAKSKLARYEAIKDFAERLKVEVSHIPAWGSVAKKKINNLVKEMTDGD